MLDSLKDLIHEALNYPNILDVCLRKCIWSRP